VYQSQQRSTYLCTESTDILLASISVVDMNYDHFESFLAPPTILYERILRRPRGWTIYVLIHLGWLSIFCYTVGCRTAIMTINLSWLCRILYRVFPARRLFVCLLYIG
jgi:hypothetical protein